MILIIYEVPSTAERSLMKVKKAEINKVLKGIKTV